MRLKYEPSSDPGLEGRQHNRQFHHNQSPLGREENLNHEAARVAGELEGRADDKVDAVRIQDRRNHPLHQLRHLQLGSLIITMIKWIRTSRLSIKNSPPHTRTPGSDRVADAIRFAKKNGLYIHKVPA